MAYRVVLQPRAEQDIEQAFQFVEERAPGAASRWYSRLREAITSLAEMPTRCALALEADKLGVCLRQLVSGKRSGTYRIVFLIREDLGEVHVLAVRHSSRKPVEPKDLE